MKHAKAEKIKKYAALFLMAAICFILGFGLTLQIRSVSKSKVSSGNTDLTRAQDLQTQLSSVQTRNEELQNSISDLRRQLSQYKSGEADTSSELENAEILAGLVDVHGPGVTVTMDDGVTTAASSGSASAFIIHDSDVLSVLNELRDAGAEALSINDERILATSEVRCAGSTISINNNRYTTPFIIRAVGDPDKLRSALMMKDGVVDVLTQWGISISIQTNSSVTVKAYEGKPSYKYAKAAQGGN